MRIHLFLALGLAFVWGVTACKKDNPPSTTPPVSVRKSSVAAKVDTSLPGDPVAGEKVFKSTCIACHGADGRGNGGITAADFVKEPERLEKSNQALIHSITNGITRGSRVMPPQKDILKEQQIKDVLSYFRKTFGKKK